MQSIGDIIEALGGGSAVSRLFDPPLSAQTVFAWVRRESIPPRYWPVIIDRSDGRITAEMLVHIHSQAAA